MHTQRPQEHCVAARRAPVILLAVADDADQAGRALASGADMIDATGAGAQMLAAIRACYPAAMLWTGTFGTPVDVDLIAGGDAPVAAVVAAAAIHAWRGAAIIRTRHVQPVRRALDMAAAIAGTRLPSLTIRGLA